MPVEFVAPIDHSVRGKPSSPLLIDGTAAHRPDFSIKAPQRNETGGHTSIGCRRSPLQQVRNTQPLRDPLLGAKSLKALNCLQFTNLERKSLQRRSGRRARSIAEQRAGAAPFHLPQKATTRTTIHNPAASCFLLAPAPPRSAFRAWAWAVQPLLSSVVRYAVKRNPVITLSHRQTREIESGRQSAWRNPSWISLWPARRLGMRR
jgi:hypothetical protein